MMTYDEWPVAAGRHSFAQLSRGLDVSTAVIFVHGFKGHPSTTWADFQSLTNMGLAGPWWRECDLYFYGYDSTHSRIGSNAATLSDFISRVFPCPDPVLFEADKTLVQKALSVDLPRGSSLAQSRQYSKLRLVAHSEGGVIVRKTVLEAVKQYHFDHARLQPWHLGLLNATLRLFAPAIMGASPSGRKGIALAILNVLPGPLRLVRTVVQGWLGSAAAYGELQPESRALDSIQRATEHYWDENPYLLGLQAAICWGEREDVVAIGEYKHDWPTIYVPGQDHVSVCKPDAEYLDPLTFVSENYGQGRI